LYLIYLFLIAQIIIIDELIFHCLIILYDFAFF